MNKLYILLVGLIIIVSGCASQRETELGTQCQNIDDQYEKDSCYSKIVVSETLLFKDCIKNGKSESDCKNNNIKTDLVNICSKIDDETKRELCYTTLVFIYDDYELCKNIENSYTHDECFMFRVHKLYDCKYEDFPCHLENINFNSDYCNNIYNSNSKLFCEAIIENDYNKCEQVDYKARGGSNLDFKCRKAFSDKYYNFNKFEYERDGKKYERVIIEEVKPAMEWIKNNLPEDAIISSWWDYGHMIRGIGNRDVIVFTPSKGILDTMSSIESHYYFPPDEMPTLFKGEHTFYRLKYMDKGPLPTEIPEEKLESVTESDAIIEQERYDSEKYGELSTEEDIKNVALILTTTNPQEAINLMKNYNSKYILVTSEDYGKAYIFYKISGVESKPAIVSEYLTYQLNGESIFHKMLQSQPIDGFERVYSDSSAVIYKIK